MEIQERLYSVCMTEDELALFSEFQERIYGELGSLIKKAPVKNVGLFKNSGFKKMLDNAPRKNVDFLNWVG